MLTVSPHKLYSVSYVSAVCYTHYQTFCPTPRQAYSPKINPPPVRTLTYQPRHGLRINHANKYSPNITVRLQVSKCGNGFQPGLSLGKNFKLRTLGKVHMVLYSLQVKSRFYILKCLQVGKAKKKNVLWYLNTEHTQKYFSVHK